MFSLSKEQKGFFLTLDKLRKRENLFHRISFEKLARGKILTLRS
jgi:hypothetical protein